MSMDKKYYYYVGCIVAELARRGFTVATYRHLFNAIYYVAYYRQQFLQSETSETEALARWSLGDARDNLDRIMTELSFDSPLKDQVRYVAESNLSATRL